MARLPIPDSDADQWGALLNEFLLVSHQENGTLRQTWQDVNTVNTIADLRALPPPEIAKAVVVLGYWSPGDGGGGVFYWDRGSGVDNGGTVIVPDGSSIGKVGPCWRRIFSGSFNVRWFGARGNHATSTDGTCIQNAVNAAATQGGGTVFIPVGEYWVQSSIILPKRAYGQPFPLTIKGEGPGSPFTPTNGQRNGSQLRWVTADTNSPILTYKNDDPSDTYFHTIEDIGFLGGDGFGIGPLFSYPLVPGGANGVGRWRRCAIRNCCFFSGLAPNVTLISIAGGWNSVIENVIIDGGDIGLSLASSSRTRIINFQTLKKNGTKDVIVINGGSCNSISHTRFEGSSGTLIKLTGGTSNVTLDTISTEGYNEPIQFDIENAHDVSMRDIELGTPEPGDHKGLRVAGGCSNVRVRGGTIAAPVVIEAGAKHIHFDEVTVIDNAQGIITISDDSASTSKTKDVVLNVYEHAAPNPIYSFSFRKGVIDPITMNDGVMWWITMPNRSGSNLFAGSARPMNGIEAGQDGQVITLLLTESSTLNAGVAGLPARAAPLYLQFGTSGTVVPANSTLQFVYRAGGWYELGRSKNS